MNALDAKVNKDGIDERDFADQAASPVFSFTESFWPHGKFQFHFVLLILASHVLDFIHV